MTPAHASPFSPSNADHATGGAAVSPLSRLWRLLAQERPLVIAVYGYAALAGLFGLTLPLGVQAIVGLVSGGLILQPVVLLVAFVVLGTLANGALQLQQLHVVETVQQRVFARLAFDLTGRLRQVRLDRLGDMDLAESMNRFFEIKTVQKSLAKLLTDWVAAGLQVVLGLLLLTFYHPYFSLFGVLLLGGLVLVFRLTAPRGWQTSLGESRYKYRVAHWLEELARTSRTFRFAGRTALPEQRMEEEVSAYLGYRAEHFKVLVRQSVAFVGFKTLITAGLLVLGSLLVVNRQITLGQFVASEIVIVTVLLAVEKLILGLSDVYDILTALEKAGHAASLPTEGEDGISPVGDPARPGVAISLHGARFQYEGATAPALHETSLAVGACERVGVTGPRGSGVSTLLGMVAGILPSYEGVVTLNGVSWRDLEPAGARGLIGWVGADPDLFDGSLWDNLAIGRPQVTAEEVLTLLDHVGLGGWVAALPDGLRTQVRAGGRALSRGVVVRLQVVRALVTRPRLLVVDGALDQLDPSDRGALFPVLFPARSEWTSLVGSVQRDVLAATDRIIRLAPGQPAVSGPTRTMLAEDSWCQALAVRA
ncbi:MAG: ABC transporter ATP-binding protein [Gemmatimonadetes bacterium]|nr:ABC transporter ATP-binding protein [Gemmatimonadota bacterium]